MSHSRLILLGPYISRLKLDRKQNKEDMMKKLTILAMFCIYFAMSIPAAAQTVTAPSGHEPTGRRKLMQEQMGSMRDGMKIMNESPGCQMMAGGMKGGESGKMEMKPMGMGPMMCHQMMEKKMEMMQVMMEGLIEASQMKR